MTPSKTPYMSAPNVRRAFLDYFPRNAATRVVASSSLVPGNDPTLLFTNAGMVQFKDVFLGKDQRAYVRAATQPALRARRRQAQRPRERRLHRPAPHLLRDAGQLQLRRLLQARRDPLRLGVPHRHAAARPERLWVTVYQDDDEAAEHLDRGDRRAGRPRSRASARSPTSGRWATPAPAAPAPRSSTTTARTSRAARRARPTRTATATSRSGTWCSCSSTARADGTLTPLPKPRSTPAWAWSASAP